MAQRFNTVAYYSRVRFATAKSGAGPHVYTIAAATTVRAFGYGVGQDMAVAGRSGTTATEADTNLQTAGRTNPGQSLRVRQIGIQVGPGSNPRLAALVWAEASWRLQVGIGETQLILGPAMLLPGGGGLYGGAEDNIGAQPLPGGRPTFWHQSNGIPGIGNMFLLPEEIVWQPEGSADSSITVVGSVTRAVTFTTQLADEAAAAGIRGFANPAAADVFVDALVILKGVTEGARSAIL